MFDTDFVINYLYNLEIDADRLHKKHIRNSCLDIITTSIEVIEISNRTFLWRFIEYIVVLFNFILFNVNNHYLINYSIGRYQVKIEHILDKLDIVYRKEEKRLYIND